MNTIKLTTTTTIDVRAKENILKEKGGRKRQKRNRKALVPNNKIPVFLFQRTENV